MTRQIGLGNCLVPPDKPLSEQMPRQFYIALWFHYAIIYQFLEICFQYTVTNPCRLEITLGNIIAFIPISKCGNGACSWNAPLMKTRIRLSCISNSLLLMTWRRKKTGRQRLWYWHSYIGMMRFSTRKGLIFNPCHVRPVLFRANPCTAADAPATAAARSCFRFP